MTTQRHSETPRYGSFETATGSVVLYDVENHQAWLQSNAALALDTMV